MKCLFRLLVGLKLESQKSKADFVILTRNLLKSWMEILGNGVLLFGVRWLCGIIMVSGTLSSVMSSEMDVGMQRWCLQHLLGDSGSWESQWACLLGIYLGPLHSLCYWQERLPWRTLNWKNHERKFCLVNPLPHLSSWLGPY